MKKARFSGFLSKTTIESVFKKKSGFFGLLIHPPDPNGRIKNIAAMPDTWKSPPSLASDDAWYLHEHLSWIDHVNNTIASCYCIFAILRKRNTLHPFH